MRFLSALLFCLPLSTTAVAASAVPQKAFLQKKGDGVIQVEEPPGLDEVILDRAKGNAAGAVAAQKSAIEDRKLAEVTAEARNTFTALERARAAYRQAETSVPQARNERTRARRADKESYEIVTQVEDLYNSIEEKIVEDASDKAAEKIVKKVGADAKRDAQRAYKRAVDGYAKNKKMKIAEAVADAMQPYHLTVLRLQKTVETLHSQAHSAIETAKKMQGDAEGLAVEAQGMQGKGMPYQASQLMQTAHGMMSGAASLKKQAESMYNKANEVNASIGGYQLYESMAGASAASTTTLNKPIEIKV